MATLDKYPLLVQFSWSISKFVDACQNLSYKEYDHLRYQLSSDLDQFLLNSNKEDEEYIKNNERKIKSFKVFLTKALNYIHMGEIGHIGLPCIDYEISELDRLRKGLK